MENWDLTLKNFNLGVGITRFWRWSVVFISKQSEGGLLLPLVFVSQLPIAVTQGPGELAYKEGRSVLVHGCGELR